MKRASIHPAAPTRYPGLVTNLTGLLESARRTAARTVNSVMTAVYWETGRRIVEFEQRGARRADYGGELLARLSRDLTARFHRGFSVDNLESMRRVYLCFPPARISETLSRNSSPGAPAFLALPGLAHRGTISETPSRKFDLATVAGALPLPWSHYVVLVRRVESPAALEFYHAEALRGGWSVRQLERQINTRFFERAALSRDKVAMLRRHAHPRPGEIPTAAEELRDPLLLEFLDLKDEYSESDLEDALLRHLESFLLELGGDLAFVGRQRRLRIGNRWHRIDLIFFHRRLRCLLVIDLKIGEFTHADAGQMNLYVNYAREHWAMPGENPPIGLVLCSEKDDALARYALAGLENKIFARDYRIALPAEAHLAKELTAARRQIERHRDRRPR